MAVLVHSCLPLNVTRGSNSCTPGDTAAGAGVLHGPQRSQDLLLCPRSDLPTRPRPASSPLLKSD